MKNSFSILRQSETAYREATLVKHHALMADIPLQSTSIHAMEGHTQGLRDGNVLPIGSVEFVRKAMALAGIPEPENLTYPEPLRPALHRAVQRLSACEVRGPCFVKPVVTKAFTGFVLQPEAPYESLNEHDQEQLDQFRKLESHEQVWVCEPVTWVSEYRVYVSSQSILGAGRYDDGPDEAPEPDMTQVETWVRAFASTPNAPVSYSLDVGVLATGETALVECNDAWALGYYKGTLSVRDYVGMLWSRWSQLTQARLHH